MPSENISHLVFVDFENVPSVDLDAIGGLPVLVTLLIGKNQTKLDTALVMQIQRRPAQVRLIEAGASGRNALDLILAYYLGCAATESAGVELHIVSKDKDFDPLISHLRGRKVAVSRSESFATLPFLRGKTAPATHKKPAPAGKKAVAVDPAARRDATLEKLISRLKNNLGPRPKRKTSLLHHINAAFGNRLTEEEMSAIVGQLIADRVLAIDAEGKVTY